MGSVPLKQRRFRFTIRFLFVVVSSTAVFLALTKDVPYAHRAHGSFTLSSPGEISVYEFYDSPHHGQPAVPGKWFLHGRWVNRGKNSWTPVELLAISENVRETQVVWDKEFHYCSVAGSMTSITDAKYVRDHGAYPISVPWSDDPISGESGFIGEYDEFWEMSFSMLVTPYGTILVAGNGDDGAFKYYFGRNANGRICAVRCVLEPERRREFLLRHYYAHPWSTRMWWNLEHRLGGLTNG